MAPARTARPVRLVDAIVGWAERQPGGAIAWIVGFGLALELVAHLASWIFAERPVGELVPEYLFPVPFMAYFLLFIVVVNRIARSSFDSFAVALDQPRLVLDELRSDLTSVPNRLLLIGVVFGVLSFAVVGQDSGAAAAEPPVTGFLLGALWFLENTSLGLVVAHTIRQLRQIGRLQARASRVDLLDPGPTNAFSRLTAATAGGILLIDLLFTIVAVSDTSTFSLGVEVSIAALAFACFVLPVLGMHGRLESERGRLLRDVNGRLKAVTARIHAMVDADDLGPADGLQKAETALIAERDLYLHISTWPWSTTTFRGLASAVMLPIFIGIVLRLVGHVI